MKYECDRCHDPLTPSEEVILAAEERPAAAFGDGTTRYVAGQEAIVHVDHFPPISRYSWRELSRGPLRQFRPNAE